MKSFICFLLYIFLSIPVFSQKKDKVKPEIFHIDLVPLLTAYGVAESALTSEMKETMDSIIRYQTTTDSMFVKMIALEEKTQEYEKELQAHFWSSLNETYVKQILKEINEDNQFFKEYASKYPEARDIVDAADKYFDKRAKKIKRYIDDAAKKRGNLGRLDNKQRNDLQVYVLNELKSIRGVSLKLKKVLGAIETKQAFSLPKPD